MNHEHEQTYQALLHPQVGDLYTEMYAWYLYIVGVRDNYVATLEISPPGELPKDGRLKLQSKDELVKRLSYDKEHIERGFWCYLIKRGCNVTGWMNAYPEIKSFIENAPEEPEFLC